MNIAEVTGYLDQDPVINTSKNGNSWCKFNLLSEDFIGGGISIFPIVLEDKGVITPHLKSLRRGSVMRVKGELHSFNVDYTDGTSEFTSFIQVYSAKDICPLNDSNHLNS